MSYTEGTAQYTNKLAGLLRINDSNLSDVEFNDVIQPTDFFKILPCVPASRGTQHSWTVQTTAAGAAFRDIATGISNAAAKEKTVTATLKTLDASFHRDLAKKATLGPRMSWEQYLARESMFSLNSALAAAESQLIMGTGGAAAGGFDGLSDIINIWGDMGKDVGGTGSACTRVYMLSLAEDRIAGIIGGNDSSITVGEPHEVLIKTDDGTYDADRVSILGSMGLQIAGSYSGAVAFNIDGTDGKTVDDDLLAEMYTSFPSQHASFVNCILMSRTGLKQLRDSMVTDLIPSPKFPTNWGGAGREIQIVVCDAIDAEAVNES